MNTSSLPFMNPSFQEKNVYLHLNSNPFHLAASPATPTPTHSDYDYMAHKQQQIASPSPIRQTPTATFINGIASPVSPSNFYNDMEKMNHLQQPCENFVFPIQTMNLSGANEPQSARMVPTGQSDMLWGPMSAPLSNNMFTNFLQVPLRDVSTENHQYALPRVVYHSGSSVAETGGRKNHASYAPPPPYDQDSMSSQCTVPSLPSLLSSSQTDMQSSVASSERPFACHFPGCGKTFAKQFNLKSHLRIHTTGKNFKCQECEACFRRPHDLQRHIRSIHIRNKPFSCSICSKCFARTDALKRHNGRVTSACYIPKTQSSPTSEHSSVKEADLYSDIHPQTNSHVDDIANTSHGYIHQMPSHFDHSFYSSSEMPAMVDHYASHHDQA